MLIWSAFSEQWGLGHAVTFDGVNKLIVVASDISEVSVKVDIYSKWKEWIQLYDNAKFAPAIRTTGGDAIGGGAFTGDVYFLINGWRLYIDHSCVIDGVLFSDDFPSPFEQVANTHIVTNKVSSLSTVISPTVVVDGIDIPSVQEIRAEIDSNSTKLTSIESTVESIPTATQIRVEMDVNSTKLTNILSSIGSLPTTQTITAAVRAELTAELAQIMSLQNGLTTAQATMLIEMYALLGLNPAQPLVVTTTSRTAGPVTQSISSNASSTTVTRT